MAPKEYKVLTPEMRQHFLEHGWVRVPDAVPLENVKYFVEDVWVRLGYDPKDKSTWEQWNIQMPSHRQMRREQFMPKGWQAVCELVGGEDRIDAELRQYIGNGFVANFGDPKYENAKEDLDPHLLGNWHIDGDWFKHFLDSGDQSMTIIVLFNDIKPRAGGTYVAEDGIKNVAKWLYEHPEGAENWPLDDIGARTVCDVHNTAKLEEMTGNAGDIIILHPFMPHSGSKNYLRVPRFIINPTVILREPLKLHRENSDDYSLVEQKIRIALSENGITEEQIAKWKVGAPRRRFTPRVKAAKDQRVAPEIARMRAHAESSKDYKLQSTHLDGTPEYYTVIPIEGY